MSEHSPKDDRPLELHLQDTEWPLDYIDHDRHIVRAMVVDETGIFSFNRVYRADVLGHATLIETAGGGVEAGEDLDGAIRRELKEELGVTVDILCQLGTVSDYYNRFHRHNINHFYLCKIISVGEKHLTEDEANLFHLSTLRLSFEDAVAEYHRCATSPLGRLIRQRELPMLERAQALLCRG